MYDDPSTGMCQACDKGVSCSRHQLGKRYDPLQGTMTSSNSKFIKQKPAAKMSNLRLQDDLTKSITKNNRASDIFYAQAKAKAQKSKEDEERMARERE